MFLNLFKYLKLIALQTLYSKIFSLLIYKQSNKLNKIIVVLILDKIYLLVIFVENFSMPNSKII